VQKSCATNTFQRYPEILLKWYPKLPNLGDSRESGNGYVFACGILTAESEETRDLQRWYKTFPHGLPGVGLLVLRIAIGAKLLIEASACMLEPQGLKLGAWLLASLALGIGASFVFGFLTQLIAGISALAGAAIYIWHPAWAFSFLSLTSFEAIGIALAIALLGPGTISLDAYFFGRREIVIPRVVRS
jgi:hypothetical protein